MKMTGEDEIREGMTYEDVAALLGVRVATLYTKIARRREWSPQGVVDGKRVFSAAQVKELLAHHRPGAGLRMRELLVALEEITGQAWSDGSVRYYQRRYGLLKPERFVASPTGRGRSTSLFDRSVLDEFREWYEGGRHRADRPAQDTVVSTDESFGNVASLEREVMVDPAPGVSVKVQVGNVQVALTDAGWRTSPSVPADQLGSYVELAKERIDAVMV